MHHLDLQFLDINTNVVEVEATTGYNIEKLFQTIIDLWNNKIAQLVDPTICSLLNISPRIKPYKSEVRVRAKVGQIRGIVDLPSSIDVQPIEERERTYML